jgi:hypothetical protein
MSLARGDKYPITGAECNYFAVKVYFYLPFKNMADMAFGALIRLHKSSAKLYQSQLPTALLISLESDTISRRFKS